MIPRGHLIETSYCYPLAEDGFFVETINILTYSCQAVPTINMFGIPKELGGLHDGQSHQLSGPMQLVVQGCASSYEYNHLR